MYGIAKQMEGNRKGNQKSLLLYPNMSIVGIPLPNSSYSFEKLQWHWNAGQRSLPVWLTQKDWSGPAPHLFTSPHHRFIKGFFLFSPGKAGYIWGAASVFDIFPSESRGPLQSASECSVSLKEALWSVCGLNHMCRQDVPLQQRLLAPEVLSQLTFP